MAGPYSAGTIFLQVVPSYADFQNQLRKDAPAIAAALDEALDPELEKGAKKRSEKLLDPKGAKKSGEEAGKEAAKGYGGAFEREVQGHLKQAMDNIPKLKIDADASEADRELAALRARLEKLSKQRINIDMNADEVLAETVAIRRALNELTRRPQSIDFQINSLTTMASVDKMIKGIETRLAKPIPVKLDPLIGSFERELKTRIKAAQASLPPLQIGAAATQAEQVIRDVHQRLRDLDTQIDIGIRGNDAIAEVEMIHAMIESLPEHVDITVFANQNRALAELAEVLLVAEKLDHSRPSVHVDVDGAGKATAELAAVGEEADGINGRMGNTANAFRAFNGVMLASVTIGPLLIPILGAIAGGLLAIGPAAIGGAVGLGVLAAGFSGLGGALTALQNYRKTQAKDTLTAEKTTRTAAKGVADAQRSAADGIRSALRTQEEAERSLQRAQRDSIKAQQDLVEARRQAVKDIADLNSQAKGGKLDERQGVIDVFNATIANQAAQTDPGATNLEKEQAAIALERARLALADTRRNNADLAQQQAKIAKEGVNGTQRVQDAQDRVTSALQAQQDATRRLGEASAAVDRARVDGARRVADALDSQREAAQKTGDIGSAALINLNDQMDKLGPAGQHFVYFLAGLQKELYGFRDAIQAGLLPGVEDAISQIIDTYGPAFTKFLGDMGTTLGDIFRQTADVLQGPAFRAFFGMMNELAPIFTQQLADIVLNLLEAFANIMTALAPFSKDFGDALVGLSEDFKTWTENLASNKEFKAFLAYVRREGPKVLEFIGALLGATLAIAQGLAPYADKLLDFFTGVLDWIAGLDPKAAGAFALAIMAIVAAVQIAAGLISAVVSGIGVLGLLFPEVIAGFGAAAGAAFGAVLPFVAIAAAIIGVGIGLVILYKKSETFRDIVNAVFHAVADAAIWLWQKVIVPAAEGIWGALKGIGSVLKWVWDNIIFPIIDLFGAVVTALWTDILKPTFGWIGDQFTAMGRVFRTVWDDTIGKVIGWIEDKIGVSLPEVFETGVGLIGDAWNKLIDLAKKPVKFVIGVLNDGIIDPFNLLAGFFHTKKMAHIPVPKGWDVGGYTGAGGKYEPAGIVHRDEYVIRKESTNKLRRRYGLGWLDHLNRFGDMPGYARGGLAGGDRHGGHPFGGTAALLAFGRLLQQMGFRVSENPAFGGVHPVHAKNSMHYSGQAIDVNWAPGTSPEEQREIDKLIPIARDYGLRVIWRVKDHFNHAHFDTGRGSDQLGGGSDGGVLGFLKGLNPIDWIKGQIDNARKGVIDHLGGGGIGELLSGVVDGVGDMVRDAVLGLAGSIGDFLKSGVASDPSGGAATAIGQMVKREASLYGWGDGGQWDALRTLIGQESSWNPLAKNPSSSAYGLFQFLDGTWSSVGGYKTSDPAKQAQYGLKYIKQRYGTPEAAMAFHNAHGYYSEGGLVGSDGPAPTLYDTGGVLPPGITNIVNASGRPEAVFTNDQWKTFERIADGRSGGGGLTVDARSYGTQLTPDDVVEEIVWATHRIEQGGKYAPLGAGIGRAP